MKTYTYPMVGMHYRPPSAKLVQVIPMNTRLSLMAEPHNEFDSNAIAVWLDLTEAMKNQRVAKVVADHNDGELAAAAFVQLGYLPKEVAKHLRQTMNFPIDREIPAKFYIPFGSNVPHARFDLDLGGGPN